VEVKMPESSRPAIQWLATVEDHDYPAAASYLSLLFEEGRVADLVNRLREAPIVAFKAKDLFRASGLPLLGISNAHVEKDQRKIRMGTALSPLLLVRGGDRGPLMIADGYHRLCAIYGFDEDALIQCKIV
jgi:hypothetical protein